MWGNGQGLNLRPSDYESPALPAELPLQLRLVSSPLRARTDCEPFPGPGGSNPIDTMRNCKKAGAAPRNRTLCRPLTRRLHRHQCLSGVIGWQAWDRTTDNRVNSSAHYHFATCQKTGSEPRNRTELYRLMRPATSPEVKLAKFGGPATAEQLGHRAPGENACVG